MDYCSSIVFIMNTMKNKKFNVTIRQRIIENSKCHIWLFHLYGYPVETEFKTLSCVSEMRRLISQRYFHSYLFYIAGISVIALYVWNPSYHVNFYALRYPNIKVKLPLNTNLWRFPIINKDKIRMFFKVGQWRHLNFLYPFTSFKGKINFKWKPNINGKKMFECWIQLSFY